MKSVYTGGEKVAEFESYDELRIGDSKPAFIYEGNELVYPAPVKDGLILHYDFSGRTNADSERGVAEDLSGNGNHGTLQNFNYTPESGYDKNKLLFDGVDDYVSASKVDTLTDFSVELVFQRNSAGISTIAYLTTEANTTGYGMVIQTNRIRYWSDPTSAQSGVNINQFVVNLDKQHVIITFEKGELKVYRNGKLGTSETINFPSNLKGFALGRYDNVLSSPLLSGIFQSTKIYNRPLTPSEIAHNYAIEKERFGIE